MGFKNLGKQTNFADFILKDARKNNRCLQDLKNINDSINWTRIESILMGHYAVGKGDVGADAYSPLVLFKCLLLQKWFRINSDPELECQINDRDSFRSFLGLSLRDSAPDHSTFSRFRKRLSKKAMDQINSEILGQFSAQGLTINEGIAIDARLVKSASHPISNKEIKERKNKRSTPEGQVDKNGNPLKFSRDVESDWTVKNDTPHYGLKEHASVDTNYGFILTTTVTPASVNDTNYMQSIVRFIVCIPNSILRRSMLTRAMPENPTETF